VGAPNGTLFASLPGVRACGIKRDSNSFRGPRGVPGGREGLSTSISLATRGPHVIPLSIFVSVLALAVVTLAFGVWHTSTLHTRELESLRSMIVRSLNGQSVRLEKLEKLAGELKSTAPISLAAEVAGLTEAVARLKATHQRFAGRFDAYVHHEKRQPQIFDGETGAVIDDEDLAAELALQRAPNGAPGSRG